MHSHIRHLHALIEMARREGVERVHVHAFTDGRDVSPTSGAGFLETVPNLATVCGRYFGMDRDRRWDRTKRAYDAIVHGVGAVTDDPVAAVRAGYERGTTDEFIEPIVVGDPAQGRVRGDDAVVFFNFRPDRCRQLFRTLLEPGFDEFDRGDDPPLPALVQMTEYSEDFHAPVAYPSQPVTSVLAQVLASSGVSQLHVAETEKYPHVTYFFDGGSEHRSEGERWSLVDSPRDVATYDLKPAMSADGVCDLFCDGIATGCYGFGLVNFANADMVGHSGVIPAVVEAVETVDRCLGRVTAVVERTGGDLPGHRRPRKRRADAGAGRQPAHRAHHQPGAADRRRLRRFAARGRPSGRHRTDGSGAAGAGPAGGDGRPQPAGRCPVRKALPARHVPGVQFPRFS